jgi:hypothetical protein
MADACFRGKNRPSLRTGLWADAVHGPAKYSQTRDWLAEKRFDRALGGSSPSWSWRPTLGLKCAAEHRPVLTFVDQFCSEDGCPCAFQQLCRVKISGPQFRNKTGKFPRGFKGESSKRNFVVRILPPQLPTPLSLYWCQECARKPACRALFRCHQVSGKFYIASKLKIFVESLWPVPRKFPFCGAGVWRRVRSLTARPT